MTGKFQGLRTRESKEEERKRQLIYALLWKNNCTYEMSSTTPLGVW